MTIEPNPMTNPHDNATRPVIALVHYDVDLCSRDKTDQGDRADFDRPQSVDGGLREDLILSGVSQYLESLVERHEKRNGPDIRIRQKGIFEIDLKDRGVRVSALEVRFPKHESQCANADEHNDGLQKRR